VNLVVPNAFKVSLAPFEQERADMKLSFTGPLIAPLKAGAPIGTLKVLVDGKPVADALLQVGADVPETNSMWHKAADSALIMLFGG